MNILKINDPKAAVAVASAGAIVLTITTTICNSFNLPGSYVALALSALMATTLVPNLKKNIVNYLFMALVIFHLAKGGNLTLSAAEDAVTQKTEMVVKAPPAEMLTHSLYTVAFAPAETASPFYETAPPEAPSFPLAPESSYPTGGGEDNLLIPMAAIANNETNVFSNRFEAALDTVNELGTNKNNDSEEDKEKKKIFRTW